LSAEKLYLRPKPYLVDIAHGGLQQMVVVAAGRFGNILIDLQRLDGTATSCGDFEARIPKGHLPPCQG
jgi:hypothetical protein